MRLLQRKILIEIIQVFALALLIILCLILMGRALQISDMLFGLEMSIGEIALIFLYMSPTFLQLAAPIACMIAVFVVFLRLENDRELVAIRAGGISLFQLFPVPFLFSFLVMLWTLWLALFGISWGMYSFRDLVLNVATTKAKVVLAPGEFNKEIPNLVLYAQSVDPLTGALQEVLVQDTSIQTSATDSGGFTILAPEGIIDTDRDSAELLFLLKNGKIYSQEDEQSTIINFREYVIKIPLAEIFAGFDLGEVRMREMSYKELKAFSFDELYASDPDDAYTLQVEIHRRFVFPFACLVLGVIALPLAIGSSGVRRQSSLVMSFVLFIVYYGALSMGINLGKSGAVHPLFGIWLPNIFFLLMAIYGVYRYNKSSLKG